MAMSNPGGPTSSSASQNHTDSATSRTPSSAASPQSANNPPPNTNPIAGSASEQSNVSASSTPTSARPSLQGVGRGRRDRPCDACRRRKSRCVMKEGAEKCLLCQFHSQECTFVQSPQPRKRKLPASSTGGGGGSAEDQPGSLGRKRTAADGSRSPRAAQNQAPVRNTVPVTDYSQLPSSGTLLKKTLGLQGNRHAHLVGPTAEYEACLIDLCPFDSNDEYHLSAHSAFRNVGQEHTFLMYPDEPTPNYADIYTDLDEIERVVAPHGPKLIGIYFRIVHPSFPILHKRAFLEKYSRSHREFAPPLLAAVYIMALNWWNYDRELSSLRKPDVEALERLAGKTMADVIYRPKLSTVQAGLLLLQRTEETKGAAWALTAQMVAVGQELGLHLDCTDWKIPEWEKGLRKRLAWALYMQDKWGALTHGRPSHISKANWAVRPVQFSDFPENEENTAEEDEDEEGSQEVEKGSILFSEMIKLSGLMAEVLDTFFTVEAQMALGGGRGITQKVLERCKPIQLRLKDWFSKLPECLRMDATAKPKKLSSTGYLHLAYFATEITLHRQILRTLSPPASVDPYLLQICRSAAKTRLISAMDFVNRLKPEHLQSFWYFASKTNFALVGTFGSLLWATSPTLQEAEFYKARLSEYRWTLRVSSRGAEFMEFAVGVLDASAGYLQQEELRKKGFFSCSDEAGSTVVSGASGLNFGLGMGVGLGIDISAPPPPPPPGWSTSSATKGASTASAGRAEPVQQASGQLSPVSPPTDVDLQDVSEGEDDMMMLDEESYGSNAGGPYEGDPGEGDGDGDGDGDEDEFSDGEPEQRQVQGSGARPFRTGLHNPPASAPSGRALRSASAAVKQERNAAPAAASTPPNSAAMDFFMIPNHSSS